MSPEQVIGGTLDGRSDLFSVGVVLAEMLMGRRLFTAPNELDVLLMVRDVRLERLDKYGCDLPNTLDAIVRRALKHGSRRAVRDRGRFPGRAGRLSARIGERVSSSDLRAFSSELFEGGAEPLGAHRSASNKAAEGGDPAAESQPAGVPALAPAPGSAYAGIRSRVPAGRGSRSRAGRRRWSRRRRSRGHRIPIGSPQDMTPGRGSSSRRAATPTRRRGDLGVISPMRIFSELAVTRETGLLRFELPDRTKEIYLVGGAPESVTSSSPTNASASIWSPRGPCGRAISNGRCLCFRDYAGRLGDTVGRARLMKPLDVFRLLSRAGPRSRRRRVHLDRARSRSFAA